MALKTNGDSQAGGYARDVELRVEVRGLQEDVRGFRQEMADIRGNMASRADIASVQRSLDDWTKRFETQEAFRRQNERVNWPVIIGVMVSVVMAGVGITSAIGWLAYSPLKDTLARIERDTADDRKAFGVLIQTLGKEFVTRAELDARTARGQADFARINQDIRAIEAAQVPRAEHAERWRSIERDVANLQAQITQQRNDFGSSYSLKDALARMEREIDALKRERRQL